MAAQNATVLLELLETLLASVERHLEDLPIIETVAMVKGALLMLLFMTILLAIGLGGRLILRRI